jgi:hypothetical protein
LNIALLNNIGDDLKEVHGLDADGKQFKGMSTGRFKGLNKTDEDLVTPPFYTLKL